MFNRKSYYKEWQNNNREKVRKYNSDWNKRNPEKIREADRKWRKNNPEKMKEYARKYRLKNIEKERKRRREYQRKVAHKPNVILGKYKSNAKVRNLKFKLTLKELIKFIYSPCHYCGELPNPTNGIDRKDNNIGYLKENCLPCCKGCNRLKRATEYKEFLFRCNKISLFIKKTKG